MEFIKKYGITVTSYEIDKDGTENPILTHIFWGKTIEEALKYLMSHLKSDFFFSSTFAGKMTWRDNELKITYEGTLITIVPITNKREVTQDIFNKVRDEVQKVLNVQYSHGLPGVINDISKAK